MKEKKNIDRLFQEKFKDFEVHPSDAVWEKIAFAKAEKEHRKIVPLWLRLGGIAAALALLVGLGTLLNTTTDTEPTIVDAPVKNLEETQSQETKTNTFTTPSEQVAQENENATRENIAPQENTNTPLPVQNERNRGLVQSDNPQKSTRNQTNVTPNNTAVVSIQNTSTTQTASDQQRIDPRFNDNIAIVSNNTTTARDNQPTTARDDVSKPPMQNERIRNHNEGTPRENNTAVAQNATETTPTEEGKSLIDVAQAIENKEEEAVVVEDKQSRKGSWDVGAIAAPVYYGDFGGSGIDPQFNDNSKSGDVNLSYGVQVSYAVNDKLKVRTGVNSVDLSYGTNDISFAPDISATRLSGVDYDNNARFLSVTDRVDTSDQLPGALVEGFQGGTSVSNGSLQQSVGYIEVPVEAVYTVSDKKLGVEVIGGVSTLFLNDNEIAIQSQDGSRTPIGESNSLNDVSFTTNVGIGVNYKITDKVKVNVEPTLKYQLNAFEGAAADFKPYYVGVYTGVSYRF